MFHNKDLIFVSHPKCWFRLSAVAQPSSKGFVVIFSLLHQHRIRGLVSAGEEFLQHGHCMYITRGALLPVQVSEGGALKIVMNSYGKKKMF